MQKVDVYQIVTDRVIEALEAGVVPWRKPWSGGTPSNLVSRKAYRGINAFLLSLSRFSSPYWLSYKQAQSLGGCVRKGEKGTPVVFWNWVEKTNEASGKVEKIPFLRYYTVFNAEQCEGLTLPDSETSKGEFSPIEEAEKVFPAYVNGPTLAHGGGSAHYVPARDHVQMPVRESFDRPENYYHTLFHELIHSTGHDSRLKRAGIAEIAAFGSQTYAKEELVAEMGAAFLSAKVGIENTLPQTASYVQGWLKALRNDRKLVVHAAAAAQKACDRILPSDTQAEETAD